MIPCLEYAEGNSQEAVIVVEEFADKVKLLGACEGTLEISTPYTSTLKALSLSNSTSWKRMNLALTSLRLCLTVSFPELHLKLILHAV